MNEPTWVTQTPSALAFEGVTMSSNLTDNKVCFPWLRMGGAPMMLSAVKNPSMHKKTCRSTEFPGVG